MILREWQFFCLFSSLFLIALGQRPTHSITTFPNLPARIFFFDDTESAVYLDSVEGVLYVSQDEGKSWNPANGIPAGDVAMVIEHPFDNHYVRIVAVFKFERM